VGNEERDVQADHAASRTRSQGRAEASRSALEQVYREHGDRLWRSVLAYCGDRSVADDAVAEAFAQAIRRGDGIHDPERWVWKSAFRIAAGNLKERRRTEPIGAEPAGSDPEPAWDLIEALKALPDRQRACVVLHHYAGYPTAEIARVLGVTPPSVRMNLTRGRRRLRTALEGGDRRD
jgi:RNA polymerase sigma-70 factor (ECF subfamily)